MFDSALGGLENNKRKFGGEGSSQNADGQNKRRVSDGPAPPGGPRAMMGSEGRGLADRMGPRQNGGGRGMGMQVRGMGMGMGPGPRGMGMGGGGGGKFIS